MTILPGGPNVAPEQVIAGGGADVIVDWAGGALVAREKGVKLVNIAQPFNHAGLELICPKDGPVKTEADFPGHTLGVWFFGNEYPFFAWMHKLGISTDGGPKGVTVLKQNFDVSALVQKQADCISVMTYNELGQAADAGFTADKIIQFNYTDMGNDLLEDGLWALQDRLADPKFKDDMVKFVRASMKGWDYALKNPDEAAKIVVNSDDSGAANIKHERYMVGEVTKLMAGANGVLDQKVWDRTVKALEDQKILTKPVDPEALHHRDHRRGGQEVISPAGPTTLGKAELGSAFSSGMPVSGACTGVVLPSAVTRIASSRSCRVIGSLLVPGGPVRGTSKRISSTSLPFSSLPPALATRCGMMILPFIRAADLNGSVPTRSPLTHHLHVALGLAGIGVGPARKGQQQVVVGQRQAHADDAVIAERADAGAGGRHEPAPAHGVELVAVAIGHEADRFAQRCR